MKPANMTEMIHQLRSSLCQPAHTRLTDGQLLENYLTCRDRAALEALVRRHGPMVWGVCRRVLRDHHDAEDAFQATFLVLVRKAASVRPRSMVGNWLYGVAHHTALKARATTARRKGREKHVATMPEAAGRERPIWRELHSVLDDELSHLPDRYRAVIVLCDLEGKTRTEAARHLGCPEGTVAGRLARARIMLAKRLTRRGLTVSGGALAATVSKNVASAGVPNAVVSATIEVVAGPAIPVKVAALTEGVLKAMLLQKLKLGAVMLLAASLLAISGGTLVPSGSGTAAGGEKQARVSDSARPAEPRDVQVLIKGPQGMTIHLPTGAKPGAKVAAPARLDLQAGKRYRVRLTDISNRPGVELYPTLEIPKTTTDTKPFLAASAIPIEFFNRDFDAVGDGTALTKVVYLKSPEGEPNTIASYDVPGVDVIDEARKRGTILAVVRMGNIDMAGIVEKSAAPVDIEIGGDGIQGRLENAKASKAEQQARQLELIMREAATVQAENDALRARLQKSEMEVRSLLSKLEQKAEVSRTFTRDMLPVSADRLGPLLRQMAWDKYQDERLTVRTTRPVETLTLIGTKESVEWASGVIKALTAAK
jgi:RNA polymerase sigma factor (sigma-70 family)